MDAYDEVSDENREAWTLFRRMCSRFTNEFHIVPVLMRKAVEDATLDEALELSERLSLIYDVCYPPKPETKT